MVFFLVTTSTQYKNIMDDIIILDEKIGVLSLVKNAIPDINERSVIRSVSRTLSELGEPHMTVMDVGGVPTKFLPLDTSIKVLDNIRGVLWTDWRESSGEDFKVNLLEYFFSKVDEEDKTFLLSKALNSIDVEGVVKVDESTGKVSLIDIIRILCPDKTDSELISVLEAYLDKYIKIFHDMPLNLREDYDPFTDSLEYVEVHDKNRLSPVGGPNLASKIIWTTPSEKLNDFRMKFSEAVCRVLGGEEKVEECEKIAAIHWDIYENIDNTSSSSYQNTDANSDTSSLGDVYAEYSGSGSEISDISSSNRGVKRMRVGPLHMSHASDTEYELYLKNKVESSIVESKIELVKNELQLVKTLKETYECMRPMIDGQEERYHKRIRSLLGSLFAKHGGGCPGCE